MPTPRFWTETRIVEAVTHFLQREGRPPHRFEFAKAYGLPDRRLVERRMRSWQEPIRCMLDHEVLGERLVCPGTAGGQMCTPEEERP